MCLLNGPGSISTFTGKWVNVLSKLPITPARVRRIHWALSAASTTSPRDASPGIRQPLSGDVTNPTDRA